MAEVNLDLYKGLWILGTRFISWVVDLGRMFRMGKMLEELPQTKMCFACGKAHPYGLRLKMSADGNRIRCQWEPRPEHSGFDDTIHGGIIATVLDEIMAWACGILGGRFGHSVDLSIRYHHMLKPGQKVDCVGMIQEDRRGRIFLTEGELRVGEQLIATSTGKYLAAKGNPCEQLEPMFGEGFAQIEKYLKK